MKRAAIIALMTIGLGASSLCQAYYRPVEISAEQRNQVIGVGIRDVAKYIPKAVPGLSQIVSKLERRKMARLTGEDIEELNLIFFRKLPQKDSYQSGQYLLPLTVMAKIDNEGYAFINMDLNIDGNNLYASKVNKISLKNTQFSLQVALAPRKLIVSDNNQGIKMVFPLGVGSFDQSVLNDGVSLLTPRFKKAYIDQWAATAKRRKPRYFANKPFIRIITSEDLKEGHTSIGFHAQPNLDTFVRAFDSHGCMRMQLPELEALFRILKFGPHRRLPITVNFYTSDKSETPFPKREKPYRTVRNVGSEEVPYYTIDRDGLVQTKKDWDNSAPISLLRDDSRDHHHQLFDYAMAWREKKRAKRIKKSCSEKYGLEDSNFQVDASLFTSERKLAKARKVMAKKKKKAFRKNKKKYKKCLDQIKRDKGSALYRWWVH
jgi:hypothetical protein